VPGAALEAGEFNGQQKFLPWRLSWPMMLVSKKINAPYTWTEFKIKAERDSVDALIPGLDDREVFALVCSVVWAHGADPEKPFDDDDRLYKSFQWLAQISGHLRMESGAVRSSEIPDFSPQKRPTIFITWPEGLISFILKGSLQMDLRPAPLPCGRRGNCAVFFFGRYLGIPKGAAHTKDALNFIDFMLSPASQRQMIFAQPWLPVRSDGWGNLGPRQKGYNALMVRAKNLRPPPRNLKKIEKELTKAGKRLLYQNAGPWEVLTDYRDALLED
jgi:ABC-type glycerol-3-phosphate transport system substrate-binding protein